MVQGMSRDTSDEFSKTILVRYVLLHLCETLYLDPASASLKRIFAFPVGGQMVVCPPYHLLSVELMLEVQQPDSFVILVIPRWSTLTVRSPGLPHRHCNALRRLVRRKNRKTQKHVRTTARVLCKFTWYDVTHRS